MELDSAPGEYSVYEEVAAGVLTIKNLNVYFAVEKFCVEYLINRKSTGLCYFPGRQM